MSIKNIAFITSGLEYGVYEFQSNKIVKIPTSSLHMAKKLSQWNSNLLFRPFELKKRIQKAQELREKSLEYLLQSKIDKSLFANVEINDQGLIFQDRVIVLKEIFDKNSTNFDLAKIQEYIKKYISLLIEMWKFGFSDSVFNITKNNGVDKNDNVVFIDIGEFELHVENVRELIVSRIWLTRYSYQKEMNSQIQKIFREEMEKHITLENLDKYWCEKV